MKAIGLTTSEVLHSQNETGQTNERTNRKTICPNNIVCGAQKISVIPRVHETKFILPNPNNYEQIYYRLISNVLLQIML